MFDLRPFFILLMLFICSVAKADQLRELITPEVALETRFAMIRAAKKEILIQSFELGRDETALEMLALLQDASKRGVAVKIIADDMHNQLNSADMAALQQLHEDPSIRGNLEIKVFNPVSSFNPINQSYRDHSKRLIVDGVMIIGGRNASGRYFNKSTDPQENYRDFEVLTRGKGASDCAQDFKDFWDKNEMLKAPDLRGHSLEINPGPDCEMHQQRIFHSLLNEVTKAQRTLTAQLKSSSLRQKDLKPKEMDELFQGAKEVDVSCETNNPHKSMSELKENLMGRVDQYLFNNAKDSVTFVAPYLFPTRETMDILRKLKQRGVQIKIVTNSLATTDMPVAYGGYLSVQKELADLGAEVYEYAGPNILHSKLIVVDEGSSKPTVITGSFNLDRRSAVINREIGVIISGKDAKTVAQTTGETIQGYVDDSILTVKAGRVINQDKIEALMQSLPPDQSFSKSQRLETYKGLLWLFPNHI